MTIALSLLFGLAAPTFAEAPNPWIDIMAYGAVADGTSNGGTDNTGAIRAAIAAATTTAVGSGVVFIPPGSYWKGSSTIVIPARVRLIGAGPSASIVYSNGSGYAFQLGNTAGTLSYGTEFSNINLELVGPAANGLDLYGTQGAVLKNDFIGEALVTNPHRNVCILIDGANISSFKNKIDSVFCDHVQTGILCKTSGSTNSTQQFIENLYVIGDDESFPGNGSVGIDLGQGLADDCQSTLVYGGDLESVTTGFMLRQNAGPIYVSGTRFENAAGSGESDVQISSNAKPSVFMGLMNLTSGITDLAGATSLQTYLGNMNSNNRPAPSLIQTPVMHGAIASIGNVTGSGYFARGRKSIAQLLAIIPTATGQEYFCADCSPMKLVISTGTRAGNFADAAGGAFK